MISSLVLFFLGFLYSYCFHKDGQKQYEITVFPDTTFAKEQIYYYYVWNSGKTTIFHEDLLNEYDGFEVYFEDKVCVEYVKISDQTSRYFNLDVVKNSKNIKIHFDLLRPDEGFTLMVKGREQPKGGRWHLPLKHRKDIFKFPRFIKARGKTSMLYLANNLSSFTVLTFVLYTYFVADKTKLSDLSGFVNYFQFFVYTILAMFAFYMLPVLFNRIKAARPPIELKLHFINKR